MKSCNLFRQACLQEDVSKSNKQINLENHSVLWQSVTKSYLSSGKLLEVFLPCYNFTYRIKKAGFLIATEALQLISHIPAVL